MPLDDRWYMHDRYCDCVECRYKKQRVHYDEIENPNDVPEIVDLKNLKKKRKRYWWSMFFPDNK